MTGSPDIDPQAPALIRLEDYRPPDWLIDRVEMDLNIRSDGIEVRTSMEVKQGPNTSLDTELCLLGEGLELCEVQVDGQAYNRWHLDGEHLRITPPAGRFLLTTISRMQPEKNRDLMGLYRSGNLYCTQCEPEGFRRITWYPDRPDILARFRTRIEADRDACPVLLSNGNPVDSGEAGPGRHYVIWDDPHPKPCYLFALVAGDLERLEDTFTTCSGRRVDLHLYASPGKARRMEFALEALKAAMEWDERRFGREYDLDLFQIAAVDDFNFGAMENKGLNIFNASALYCTPELTTDAGFRNIRSIVAHEYFHNWSGNRVTLRDWFQLCLKEGFTVFRDQQFSCDFEGEGEERIRQVRTLKERQFPEDTGPLAHPPRPSVYRQINNFYTATVYEKGAEVVRMLSELLGEVVFRAGCDLYFKLCDGTAARVEDLVSAMEQVSGRDLQPFMRWYTSPGIPALSVRSSWHPEKGEYRLQLDQHNAQQQAEPRHIPVRTALLGPDGQHLHASLPGSARSESVDEWLLEMTSEQNEWVFGGLKQKPVLSLLRGFSAPVQLQHSLGMQDRLVLARQKSDDFGRWEAIQELYDLALKEKGGDIAHLVELWLQLIDESDLPDGMRALLMALPAPAMAYQQKPARPVEFVAARGMLNRRLATACREQLQQQWQARAQTRKPYSPDPAAMGQRAFANLALHLLVLAEVDSGYWQQQCRDQALSADNLTDRLGGIVPLLETGAQEGEEVLEVWQQDWRDESLLMHQWLAVQARVPAAATLDRVVGLTSHPAFNPDNPNSVRALLGCLSANDAVFHRADGASYHFLAHWIGELDAFNPMVASSLAGAFARCAFLPSLRRAEADRALETLRARSGLSSDLTEQLLRLTPETSSSDQPDRMVSSG